jgi:hypothetical protein
MTRDWTLIRDIMLKLEESAETMAHVNADAFPGRDPDFVSYQIQLLIEAGLIEGHCAHAGFSLVCEARTLTWAGHEFLDHIRSATLWRRIRETVKSKGLELSFQTITIAAGAILKHMMN